MDKKDQKVVEKLLTKQKVVYLGSVDQAGYPNTKAMEAPRKQVGSDVFYFSTNANSAHVAQFLQNPKSSLYFCDPRSYTGVMLIGTVEVLTDQVSKDMLWQESDTTYFPAGVTDPSYCVLRFTATGGRLYNNYISTDFPVQAQE